MNESEGVIVSAISVTSKFKRIVKIQSYCDRCSVWLFVRLQTNPVHISALQVTEIGLTAICANICIYVIPCVLVFHLAGYCLARIPVTRADFSGQFLLSPVTGPISCPTNTYCLCFSSFVIICHLLECPKVCVSKLPTIVSTVPEIISNPTTLRAVKKLYSTFHLFSFQIVCKNDVRFRI